MMGNLFRTPCFPQKYFEGKPQESTCDPTRTEIPSPSMFRVRCMVCLRYENTNGGFVRDAGSE